MLRRIYFALPDVPHTRRIVDELQAAGINEPQTHIPARAGVDLSDLPVATDAQRKDRVWVLENLFWNGDLILFGLATIGLVMAIAQGSAVWTVGALAVMLASFVAGNWFSARLPHAHLDDLRVPLEHGEVVLMIDVPLNGVREIEQLVSRHHPEADIGGVGWTIPALGT